MLTEKADFVKDTRQLFDIDEMISISLVTSALIRQTTQVGYSL